MFLQTSNVKNSLALQAAKIKKELCFFESDDGLLASIILEHQFLYQVENNNDSFYNAYKTIRTFNSLAWPTDYFSL